MRFKCQNGPFANHKLFLGKEGRGYTFEFTIYNITGYYRFGEWHDSRPSNADRTDDQAVDSSQVRQESESRS
jgi:hypothetical protein